MAYRDSNSTAGSCIAGEKCEKDVYLVLYGSGFLTPTYGASHNTGNMFELSAKARYKINKEKYPEDEHRIFHTPTDYDFFRIINSLENIIRLDIYSHAWVTGLNMGGFTGKKVIKKKVIKQIKYIEQEPYYYFFSRDVEKIKKIEVEEDVELDSDTIDWSSGEGEDLRHVNTRENIKGKVVSELNQLNSKSFKANQETYIWGCNAGGQLDHTGKHIAYNGPPLVADVKITFAQKLSEKIGKGKTYALVGKGATGGSMFKWDKNGKAIYTDGEMLPANIALNNVGKDTSKIKAKKYLKKFPL